MPRAVDLHPAPAPDASGPTPFAHPAAPIPVGPRNETANVPPSPPQLAADVTDPARAAAIDHMGQIAAYNAAMFAQVARELTPARMR